MPNNWREEWNSVALNSHNIKLLNSQTPIEFMQSKFSELIAEALTFMADSDAREAEPQLREHWLN